MTTARRLLERAEEFLASAEDDADAARPHAAMLHAKHGEHPRRHAIGGDLHPGGLLPASLDARFVARLLKERTRADYGFDPIDPEAADEALAVARALVVHARRGLDA